jgi:hypothetical protein
MKLLEQIGFKKLLPIAASLLLVVAIVSVLGTREVHALVATLVQVVNTPNQPVPNRDVDHPANEPFQFEAISRTTPVNFASFTTPTTTADGKTVQRLVIELVTVSCSALPSPASGIRVAAFPFSRAGANLGLGTENDVYLPFPNNPAATEQVLSQQTRIYVDPGVSVSMNALSFESGGVCAYTASGYFVVQ